MMARVAVSHVKNEGIKAMWKLSCDVTACSKICSGTHTYTVTRVLSYIFSLEHVVDLKWCLNVAEGLKY